MTSVLFGLIALFLIYVINLVKVEYTFFILFFAHLVSGVLVEKHTLSIAGVSATGLINLLTLGMLVLNLPRLLRPGTRLQHNFLVYSFLLFLFFAAPVFYNFDFQIFTRFISKFGAGIAIYYLAQLSFQRITDLDRKFIVFLKWFFVLICIAGVINALSLGLSVEEAKIKKFSFFLFEYPHSFSLFSVSLLPIFFFYIHSKELSAYYYILIFCLFPITILFSGAKIGMIVFLVTLTGTIMLTFRKRLRNYLYAYIILALCLLVFINTPVFKELENVFSIPLYKYIYNTSDYSINSLHTRIKVWTYMVFNLLYEDNCLLGFGWRSWSLKYLALSGATSSQSDYFTILFELGILGLTGFIIFRALIVYCLIKAGKKNIKSYYLAVGCLCSLFVGGLTESVEGYASTSWLIPVFLSLSHFLGNRADACPHNSPEPVGNRPAPALPPA